MAEERKQVRVCCSIPNGLLLQLTRPVDDGSGFKQMRRYGEQVMLAGPRGLTPGDGEIVTTPIDAEFWDAWLAQNKLNPLVVGEQIKVAEEKPEA